MIQSIGFLVGILLGFLGGLYIVRISFNGLSEAAFQRGFSHGRNRAKRYLEAHRGYEARLREVHHRLKSEGGSLRTTIKRMRPYLTPEQWAEVTNGGTRPSEKVSA